jgi:hypothetical protein
MYSLTHQRYYAVGDSLTELLYSEDGDTWVTITPQGAFGSGCVWRDIIDVNGILVGLLACPTGDTPKRHELHFSLDFGHTWIPGPYVHAGGDTSYAQHNSHSPRIFAMRDRVVVVHGDDTVNSQGMSISLPLRRS